MLCEKKTRKVNKTCLHRGVCVDKKIVCRVANGREEFEAKAR